MWKIIIVSALSVTVLAEDIDKIYGQWKPIAMYPGIDHYSPKCLKFNFSQEKGTSYCTCPDGRRTTLVAADITGQNVHYDSHELMAMTVVDTPDEANAAMNVKCQCAGEEYTNREVVRSINENFFVLYITRRNISKVFVFAKRMPNASELIQLLKVDIEDLKSKSVSVMCALNNIQGNEPESHANPENTNALN